MCSHILRITLALLIANFTFAQSALEKVDLDDPQDVYLESLNNMKAQNWEGALEILSAFVAKHKPDKALKSFGPKFGWFWYHKGYCEAKMDNHKDAITSFENCYKDYPNSPDAKSKNTFQIFALYKMAESAFDQENYDLAKTNYEKFLNERDPKKNPQEDKFDKGKFYVNQATSYFKTGDVDKGLEALQTAVKNRDKFLTPPSAIFSGFDALAEACIKENNEQMILDFLKKYKKDLLADVFITSQYSKMLISRSKAAIDAKMQVVPLELISLVPNTQVAINDLKAQLKSFEGFSSDMPIRDGYILISPSHTKSLVEKLEGEAKGEEPNEALGLTLSAYLWTSSGNNRAAYAAYKELEERYPQSKNRQSNLFNLIQASNNIGKVNKAEEYGKTFLRAFPGSEQEGAVRKIMVTGLYYDKKYKECIDVAGDQYDELESSKPSEAHDTCLYVLGGSYYYTGQFQEAAKYLSQHVKEYPESKHASDASFLEASNLSRLGDYVKGGEKLDSFLTKYEEKPNHLYPYALFDRANCHYALQEWDPALARLKTLEEKYLSSTIMAAAFNLKGSILYSQEDDDRAESYYKRGLETANKNGNKAVAGESLSSLIMMLADTKKKEDRTADAVAYYDQYWADYAQGSPFQANVAVAGFPAMKKVNRADEGLVKMKNVISTVAKLPGQPMLENLVNSYTEAYLEVNTADQLKDHFYNFDGIDSEDKEANALLRIALVGAYEDEIKDAVAKKDNGRVTKLEAGVKAIFTDLKNDFNPAILTPFTLNKIANYIRNNTATPREAITYYNEIINRGNEEFKLDATFGLADIYGASNQAAEKAQAKTYLTEIYNNGDASKKDRSRALFRLIQLHVANEEWAEANARAIEYTNDDNKFTANRSQVSYTRALSFDKLGKEEEALSAYIKVNAANLGNIPISAPSTKRIMELLWKRNKPAEVNKEGQTTIMSDRQGAYEQGYNYISATERHLVKMTEEEKALWNETKAVLDKYAKSGEIVDMTTQEKNKK